MLEEFARAKVNLTLHITGQRENGYHMLDSLVMFASTGDILSFDHATDLSLRIDGPEARALPVENNSILSAAHNLDSTKGASIRLTKHLPVSSGIGGGSADAAAAYRGLSKLWNLPEPPLSQDFCARISRIGADVPVCVFSRTTRMSGIGERLEFLTHLPMLHAVLVNPRVAVSTQAVFKTVTNKSNPAMGELPSFFSGQASFISWLSQNRNDMQSAAMSLEPAISDTLNAISSSHACQLARMSGSGATCFGIYPDAGAAENAASQISGKHSDWWVQSCTLGA
ncbi:4-diphosphocytidyl-2-C-methyl-D-erythritol kinase [Litoreibacter janthinus]|uniref:4-diphosphocytidyl-2-C-methyl-D-erythritol kinase n=2 Tax=Litoreibacter janthinus TaxID=670154 RepID=A0A1I6FQE0_9RHOB|nr:4-diphosphocytidyl-2-C-methyl-D-erythritol kinase [Litoreibacter janthinus]